MRTHIAISICIFAIIFATEFAYSSEKYQASTILNSDELSFDQFRQCILGYKKASVIDIYARKSKNGNNEFIYILEYNKSSMFDINKYENAILIDNKININDFFGKVDYLMYNSSKLFLVFVTEYDKINLSMINKMYLGDEYFSFFSNNTGSIILKEKDLEDICKNRHLINHILSLPSFKSLSRKN